MNGWLAQRAPRPRLLPCAGTATAAGAGGAAAGAGAGRAGTAAGSCTGMPVSAASCLAASACAFCRRCMNTLAHSSATLSPTCSHALVLRRRSRLELGEVRLVPRRSAMVLSTFRQRTGMPERKEGHTQQGHEYHICCRACMHIYHTCCQQFACNRDGAF